MGKTAGHEVCTTSAVIVGGSAMGASKAVVIGGGLGGLSAAISLACKGWEVVIAERNHSLGGKLNVIHQDGFTFDLGPSLLTMPHILQSLFSRAAKSMQDYLKLKPLNPQWRNFYPDGTILDLTDNKHTTAILLDKHYPGTGEQFLRFCTYADNQRMLAESLYFRKGIDTLRDVLQTSHPTDIAKLDLTHSVSDSVTRYIHQTHLSDMMSYFCKYVGSSPDKAPGFLNLLPSMQLTYGLFYIQGGMYSLARALTRLLSELNVQIKTEYTAERLTSTRGGRIKSVSFQNGETIPCNMLVSDVEIIPFYTQIASLPHVAHSLEKRFPPSCSGLVIHLGVDKIYQSLAHHNIFHSVTPHNQFRSVFQRMTLPDDPTLYVVAPVRTDPALVPSGCDIIKILPQIPNLHRLRSFSPQDMKPLRERVLQKLERMGVPELRQHITSEITLTPYDIHDMYNSHRGSIYGTVSDRWKNMAFKAPQKSRYFSNLYFVGGSVNPGGGMPMVILGGMQVADRIGKAA